MMPRGSAQEGLASAGPHLELGGFQRGKDGHREQHDRGDPGHDEFALVDEEAPTGVVARQPAHDDRDHDRKEDEDAHALDVHRPAHTQSTHAPA